MKLKLQKITGHIPQGSYQGVITEESVSFDGKYLWMKIELKDYIEILNISIPINSVLFNQFALCFQDDDGNVDTEDFIDTEIKFTVGDKTIGVVTYSKFLTLEPVWEDDENDD